MDKDAKESRDKRIFDLWLACETQERIADAVGVTQGEVAKSIPNGDIAEWNKSDQAIGDAVGLERSSVTKITEAFVNIGNLAENHKAAASHATDFDLPLYNVWKQQTKTAGSSAARAKNNPIDTGRRSGAAWRWSLRNSIG